MRDCKWILILLLVSSCVSWPSAHTEQAQVQGQVGASLLESGNYPEALSALLKAEELNPKDAHVQNNLGLAYFYRGRPDKAKSHLENAIKIDPKFTDARNNLGRILIEMGEFNSAEAELKEAVADLTYTRPEKPQFNLGILYFKTKRYQEARGVLEKSLQYDRSSCPAQTLLGRTYYELNQNVMAAATLDRAIGLCPYQASDEPQYWAGMTYLRSGDTSRARLRFEEIIRLYPESQYRALATSALKDERLKK